MVANCPTWIDAFIYEVLNTGTVDPNVVRNHAEELQQFIRTYGRISPSLQWTVAVAKIRIELIKQRQEQRSKRSHSVSGARYPNQPHIP